VHFATAAAAGDCLDLRTVDDVFVDALTIDDVGHTRAALARFSDLSTSATRAAVDVVAAVRPVASTDPFDVTASFLGRRNYNRQQIEDAVGAALEGALGRRYESRQADRAPAATTLSWRVHIRDGSALLGLRLGPTAVHRRPYKTASTVGTLHPPVAAALGLLAGVEPGRRLLDPFCGAGTIVTEAVGWSAPMIATGVDIDPDALEAAAANLLRRGRSAGVVVAGDARRLPFAAGAFDRVVTNPPWERQVAFAGRDAGGEVWCEVARVTRPTARLVVLSELDIVAPPGWSGPHGAYPLGLFGRRPTVQIFTGPDADPVPLPPAGARLAEALETWSGAAITD
jgi:tRNA (guanine6-N2)-methyltransferase